MADHRDRHEELHRALDELVACFVMSNPMAMLSKTSVMELLQWSCEATRDVDVCKSGKR